MLGAQTEDLHRVRDIGVSRLASDLLGPLLDLGPGHLLTATTDPTDEMVVMSVFSDAAELELGLAVRSVHHVGPTRVDERIQVPVDGRETDSGVDPYEIGVDLLSGSEPVRAAHDVVHGRTLAGVSPRRPA